VAPSSKVYFYDPKLIIAIPIWFHDCWTKLANLLMISEQRFAMEPLPPLLFFKKKEKKKALAIWS
jgi:hypothetical protein